MNFNKQFLRNCFYDIYDILEEVECSHFPLVRPMRTNLQCTYVRSVTDKVLSVTDTPPQEIKRSICSEQSHLYSFHNRKYNEINYYIVGRSILFKKVFHDNGVLPRTSTQEKSC